MHLINSTVGNAGLFPLFGLCSSVLVLHTPAVSSYTELAGQRADLARDRIPGHSSLINSS